MGATNVRTAFTIWAAAGLNHRTFRLLTYMALVSLDEARDDTPARRYWGGTTDLALAIGYTVPERPHDDDRSPDAVAARRAIKKAHDAVDTCLGELREAGAVRLVRKPSPGRTAAYELVLDLWTTTPARSPLRGERQSGTETSLPPQRGTNVPPSEGSTLPPQRGERSPLRGEQRKKRNNEEQEEDNTPRVLHLTSALAACG